MGLVLYYGCNPQLEILLAHRPCTLLAPGLRGMYKSVLFKTHYACRPKKTSFTQACCGLSALLHAHRYSGKACVVVVRRVLFHYVVGVYGHSFSALLLPEVLRLCLDRRS